MRQIGYSHSGVSCFMLHSRSQARRPEHSELGNSAAVDVPVTLKMFMALKAEAERGIGLE